MQVYAKFMKELLSGKCKLKYDENMYLGKECSAIIQRNLLSNLIGSGRFTISSSIDLLKIGQTLCDL